MDTQRHPLGSSALSCPGLSKHPAPYTFQREKKLHSKEHLAIPNPSINQEGLPREGSTTHLANLPPVSVPGTSKVFCGITFTLPFSPEKLVIIIPSHWLSLPPVYR
jgi:hypothetical protein